MAKYLSMSPDHAKLHRPAQRDGLIVNAGHGYERMVMSDQELCDDVLATLPKLHAATHCDTFGRRWKQRKRKNGVDMYELVVGGGGDPNDDLEVAHALVAKTELRCHMNEVLNVLINQQSSDYEASMRALCGSKFKKGQLLFQQRRRFSTRTRASIMPTSKSVSTSMSMSSSKSSSKPKDRDTFQDGPEEGLVGVQLATFRSKYPMKIQTSKHRRTQRLCFSSCTIQSSKNDRAIHLMKTLPKEAHDQVVSVDGGSAIRHQLDHIAVGFDIQSKHGEYSARSHSTRVFLHAYASTVSPADNASESSGNSSSLTRPSSFATEDEVARHRKAVMNHDAKHVLEIMTKQLRQFETVIRRRRFGFQSFMYFPVGEGDAKPTSCSVCSKDFALWRRECFCQLCGLAVCKDCSQLYDVEAKVGEVRKNRCCIQCVTRVDSCVFDDEDLLSALGPVVVDADDSAWEDDYPIMDEDTDSVNSSIRSLEDISGNLYSYDPEERSEALQRLAKLVRPSVERASSSMNLTAKEPVAKSVEAHLRANVRKARDQHDADQCPVYDRSRDYAYTFRADDATVPMAPRPAFDKEASRIQHIEEAGVLNPGYDHAALDLLAKLAAKHLNCPIGYVSVIDSTEQRVIGAYQYPSDAMVVPRDETLCMHGVYAETPMVLKNPRRDMRFAQLPVVKDLGFQFYAGFPIKAADGSVVASLCTGDVKPHKNITTKDYATMEVLSSLAAELLVPTDKQQRFQVV